MKKNWLLSDSPIVPKVVEVLLTYIWVGLVVMVGLQMWRLGK